MSVERKNPPEKLAIRGKRRALFDELVDAALEAPSEWVVTTNPVDSKANLSQMIRGVVATRLALVETRVVGDEVFLRVTPL